MNLFTKLSLQEVSSQVLFEKRIDTLKFPRSAYVHLLKLTVIGVIKDKR